MYVPGTCTCLTINKDQSLWDFDKILKDIKCEIELNISTFCATLHGNGEGLNFDEYFCTFTKAPFANLGKIQMQ